MCNAAALACLERMGQILPMTDRRLTPLAQSLPATVPFVAPERLEMERGAPFDARLGANELGFGPSPAAVDAMRAEIDRVWQYGIPDAAPLIEPLAAFLGVAHDTLSVGEGIDALLGNLVRLYVGQGDVVVTSDGAYPTFNYHVSNVGGRLVKVPFDGDHEDPTALIDAAAAHGAKLIYFSNPNNPMGTVHTAETVTQMIARVPEGSLLILDEAYAEFAPADCVPPIDTDDPRVIRFRTFSKAYGMAGARIGYAIGHPEVVGNFDRLRNHFGVNRIALFGAVAALNDQTYLQDTLARVAQGRARIEDIAQQNNLTTLPSAANFVAIDCGRDGAYARAVVAELAARGIFVRMPNVAPLDRCIRVSVGLDGELDAFAACLPAALEAAAATSS